MTDLYRHRLPINSCGNNQFNLVQNFRVNSDRNITNKWKRNKVDGSRV